MGSRPALSASERDVLRVLWDHGPCTTREINEILEQQGRQWAYTTVATLLQRLSQKRYAASDPQRRATRVSFDCQPRRAPGPAAQRRCR